MGEGAGTCQAKGVCDMDEVGYQNYLITKNIMFGSHYRTFLPNYSGLDISTTTTWWAYHRRNQKQSNKKEKASREKTRRARLKKKADVHIRHALEAREILLDSRTRL